MSKMLIALPLLAFVAGCADTPPTQSQLRAQARDAAKLEETLAGYTAALLWLVGRWLFRVKAKVF